VKAKSTNRVSNSADSKTAVETYYGRLPEPAKSTLQTVRSAILSACPKPTTETISYGIPTFKHDGGICAIAAFKDHCSLFPMSYFVIDKFRTELARFEVSIKARLTQMSEKAAAKQKSKSHR
jgi:uncharacterized protein YdhG (YjbR/CyaY superfamily)